MCNRMDGHLFAHSGGFFSIRIFRAFFLVEFFGARFSKKIFKNRPQAGANFLMFFRFLKFFKSMGNYTFSSGRSLFFRRFLGGRGLFFENSKFFSGRSLVFSGFLGGRSLVIWNFGWAEPMFRDFWVGGA